MHSLDAFYRQYINGHISEIFYKKLSLNDIRWSYDRNVHQGGILLNRDAVRNFFRIDENNAEYPLDISVETYWYINDQWELHLKKNQCSAIKCYTRGGTRAPECHLTRLPSHIFRNLTERSLFLMGRCSENSYRFYCIVLDLYEDEYSRFYELFDLEETQLYGIINITTDFDRWLAEKWLLWQ